MEQLAFTALLNRLFGAPVLALLQALHVHPKHPATPISNGFAMELLVVLLLTIFFIAVRTRLSVERPGGLQHTMEAINGFVGNMADEVIGHHSEKYVPYLVTLGMFVLCCNLIGPQDKEMPFAVRSLLPAPMFLIEVFSHLARIMSLTVRLFANMFAGEMVTLVFFSLIPLGIPVLFEGLHIGVSFIQTYIFVLLACVYLREATGQEH